MYLTTHLDGIDTETDRNLDFAGVLGLEASVNPSYVLVKAGLENFCALL